MATIEDEEAARRLARAIVNDIELYNAAAVETQGDLSEPIREGRALYRERALPRLHGLFEAALEARGLARLERGTAGAQGPGVAPSAGATRKAEAPPAAHESFLVPLPARQENSLTALGAFGALLVAAAAALWFFTRG